MECLSYCIANSIDLSRLDSYIRTKHPEFTVHKLRDVLKFTPNENGQRHLCCVFTNGTVVAWGIKRFNMVHYLDIIKACSDRPISIPIHDEFTFQIGTKTTIEPHDFFDVDCVTLEEDTDDIKLGLSYGFSQSVKLQYFETINESLIEKYTPLIQKISTSKKPAKRDHIRQVIGKILAAKSEMNLISNFLYHPKFFWQHPTLEVHFIMLERYLHMQRRINAINHRLDTLNDIFEMFNSYLENRHAHNLEIIIIVLIMIEIFLALLPVRW